MGSITLGNQEISSIYVGQNKVSKIYWGSALVYQASQPILPSAYQQVEYVESNSNGSQRFNINYYSTPNTKYELVMQYTETPINYPKLFGNSGFGKEWTFSCEIQTSSSGQYSFRRLVGGYESDYNFGNMVVGNKYFIVLENDESTSYIYNNQGELVQNGHYTQAVPTAAYTTIPTQLFGVNGESQKAVMKVWSFKIYNSDVLAVDLVPCYRKFDNEIGFYDVVNNVFYLNEGTGSFTKGPDVN